MKVDVEILRGLENLGAPWDSMGRFRDRDYGIIQTIGANMILLNVPGNSLNEPRYHRIRNGCTSRF
jgi:hypothetical protein